MKTFLVYLLMAAYNLILFGGFIYLIDQRNWSPWWLAFAMCLMLTPSTKESK